MEKHVGSHFWNNFKNNVFLIRNFPNLHFVGPFEIKGEIEIKAIYLDKKLIINPPKEFNKNKEYVHDKYEIGVRLPTELYRLPELVCKDKKINLIKEKYKKKDIDIHFYVNGTACLCSPPEYLNILVQGKNTDLNYFFDNLVIPFLYQQSYFAKFGVWPISNFAHGYQSIFEHYNREKIKDKLDLNLLRLCEDSIFSLSNKSNEFNNLKYALNDNLKKFRPTKKCFCKSNKKLKKCHKIIFSKEAYKGLLLFIKDKRLRDLTN